MKKTGEKGPMYGVDLVDVLPLGTGFLQAMPSRAELERCSKDFGRVAAAYEVLLGHYLRMVAESVKAKPIDELRGE